MVGEIFIKKRKQWDKSKGMRVDEEEAGDYPNREVQPTNGASTNRRRRRSSPVWEAFHIGEDGGRVCNHCDREFGMNTSTSSLRYHLEREHEEYEVDEGRQFSAKRADMLVARFVVNNCLALQTTASSDFAALVGYLHRGYKPPGKDRLRNILAMKTRARMVEVMRKKMKTIEHFSATLDSWTSPACRPYITVTLHGATAAFKIESFMLGLVPVKASETAALIAQVVEDEINEWGIDRSKVVGLTSDGARNMSSAITTHLRVEWIYCLAHVINLCVRLALGLSNVKSVVKAAKAICRTFKASSVAKRALEERQIELGLPPRALKVDNKTRWGSTYEMLRRLTASRPAVSACLASLHGLRKPVPDDLTSGQWSLIEKIADVLEPFQDATEFLSSERHPTIGAVMPIMLGTIPAHLRAVATDGPTIKAFKKKLAKEIDIRWDILNINAPDTLLLAVYLDPRFKDFHFIADAEEREICIRRAVGAVEQLVRSRPRTERLLLLAVVVLTAQCPLMWPRGIASLAGPPSLTILRLPPTKRTRRRSATTASLSAPPLVIP